MNDRLWRIALVPVFALLFGLALAAVLSVGVPRAAQAQAGTGIIRVAPSGTDDPTCGGPAMPCETIQYAVGLASDGDEIRVAAGRYTGSQQVAAPGSSGVTTFTQVVIITKGLTVRGGYTTADWDTSVPTQNVTIIDAEGSGRGITIIGDGTQEVTVEGFTITGGDYTDLGNTFAAGQCPRGDGDCGGGLYAYRAVVVVRRSVISGNVSGRLQTSSDGGGLLLWSARPGTRLEDTHVISNGALAPYSYGGGASLNGTDMVVQRSTFLYNRASDMGGGLRTGGSGLIIIEASEFISNHVGVSSNGRGGALDLASGSTIVRGCTFISNSARDGGAVMAFANSHRAVTFEANVIAGNRASRYGGGVYIREIDAFTLTNNIIAQNGAQFGDGAILEAASNGTLIHNTIAENTLGSGSEGIMVRESGAVVTLLDNIITSHTYGIRTQNEVTVTADHTLFFDNDLDTLASAGAVVTSTNEITGAAPAYVDPAGLNYHLMCGSPAIDAGIDAGVEVDIDGDLRPEGAGFDIGADEVMTAGCRYVYLPLVLR
jgi:hypothetical protein